MELANYRTEKLVYWDPEELDDILTRGMLSLFESRLLRERGGNPSARLKEADFKRIKDFGLWIYSPDRFVFSPVDVGLQIMPMEIVDRASFCVGEKPWAYCMSTYVEKWLKPLPKTYKRTGPGQIYSLIQLNAKESGGISGQRYFLTIDKQGNAYPCIEVLDYGRWNRLGFSEGPVSERPEFYESIVITALHTMQFASDSQYTWTITAREEDAKVVICCLESEVKSLTYARSMPLTATGRRRPIRHFVSAHKRRLQNGTDIDISEYLRGITRFEMNGTQFEVKPPVTRNEVQ